MSLIGLLIAVVVFTLIWYVITLLPLPIPQPILKVVQIIFILIVIIWLLGTFFGGWGSFQGLPINK